MPRVARAAKQLLRQMGDLDVPGRAVGDLDGFGVRRSVSLDFGMVHELFVDRLASDRRVRGVAAVEDPEGTTLFVTFVAGTAADSTEPFEI